MSALQLDVALFKCVDVVLFSFVAFKTRIFHKLCSEIVVRLKYPVRATQ